MTPEQFKAWRKHMDLTQAEAAEALGVALGTVKLYERGMRADGGTRAVVIPKNIALACAAIALGIKDYAGPESPAR